MTLPTAYCMEKEQEGLGANPILQPCPEYYILRLYRLVVES